MSKCGLIVDIHTTMCSRYNPATGIFTVPTGGAGTYFLSIYFSVDIAKSAVLKMVGNGDLICEADGDHDSGAGDRANGGCSGVAQLSEGELVYMCVCVSCVMMQVFHIMVFWRDQCSVSMSSTGDAVQVVYVAGLHSTVTPLYPWVTHGFLGFRIWERPGKGMFLLWPQKGWHWLKSLKTTQKNI